LTSDQARRPAWDDRQAALPVILDDFERLHALVLAEIGHPLPQHLRDFARDWLDTAHRVVDECPRADD